MATLTPNKDQEVTITQQGSLKMARIETTPAGASTITDTHTVPVGKLWVIKAVEIGRSSFVGTITNLSYRFQVGGNSVLMKDATSPNYFTDIIGNMDFVLSAGDDILCTRVITAYTSGTVKSIITYVEIDA